MILILNAIILPYNFELVFEYLSLTLIILTEFYVLAFLSHYCLMICYSIVVRKCKKNNIVPYGDDEVITVNILLFCLIVYPKYS